MSKIRLTLYGSQNLELSDRLVDQETEYAKGPTEKHTGGIRLDVKLENKDQVNALVEYLRKLALDLPISAATAKKIEKSKVSTTTMSEEPLLDIIHIIENKYKTQEDIVQYLRGFNFRFVNSEYLLNEIEPLKGQELKLKDKILDYQFMVRMVKEAKDPSKDKYDPQLVIAMKIVGKRQDKFYIYLYGKLKNKVELPWKDIKSKNFKKVEQLYTFPEVMEKNERARFRNEDRRIKAKPDTQPTKFYLRWAGYVKHAGKVINPSVQVNS